MHSKIRCVLSSAPTALTKDILCPNFARWAAKLNGAPPGCSVSPTTSQRISPIVITFIEDPAPTGRYGQVRTDQNNKVGLIEERLGSSIRSIPHLAAKWSRVGRRIARWYY